MREFIAELLDKRFSWRFKLANFILGDELRFNLACARADITTSIEFMDRNQLLCQHKLAQAVRMIDELWKYPESGDV